MAMRHKMLDLLIPIPTTVETVAGTDSYGKEVMPPVPLSFDRINEGRPPSSNAPLFELPLEILWRILLYVPSDSLASLAFVNRDCRQLARSRQFVSVSLNYSTTSMRLLDHLLHEGGQRYANNGRTILPSIGACVRQLRVATEPDLVVRGHDLEPDDYSDDERDSKWNDAHSAFYGAYLPTIQNVVSCSLPNLRLLIWEDNVQVDECFFHDIMKSPIQYLKLRHIKVAEEYQVSLPPKLTGRAWPLQSLYLALSWTWLGESPVRSTLPLCISLLRLCAASLESLVWVGSLTEAETKCHVEGWDLSLPPFERLRDLQMPFLGPIISGTRVLEALIPPEGQCYLRSLSVDLDNPSFHGYLRKRGRITSLQRLVVETLGPANGAFDFLKANDHVSTLSILYYRTSSDILTNRLLPILSRSFTNLTSLRLTWKKPRIPAEALRYISTLKSLEQIYLSAGNQDGYQPNWLVDHAAMRQTFSQLPNLRKFAFAYDTYDNGQPESDVEFYYEDMGIPEALAEVINDARGRFIRGELELIDGPFTELVEKAWERIHLRKMLSEADKYLQEMPDNHLGWMYFGQIPMGVKSVDGQRKAYPLSPKRDNCATFLEKMFNWKTYEIV
ncbi:hypothetical protein T310_1787 [Rasamsonia emersonii CBS 393.64]|uniref:F-box domain-containing protein n=1 Tax=Rasamsonia emersonii (strain ATCC 16479 / CBS 393.64 / IMI 116815) TaxID=1408163 RepID=A0A0F4Z2Z9_RASE3|nr:hypothetical protein T310_1787 [Rasamsonia emersonii CBS 393.64]KKA24248.1 hypothetical protein T310_1787 [Rasamsonia emersonii CBS 393.64]